MRQLTIRATAQKIGIAGDTVIIKASVPFNYAYGASAPSTWLTSTTNERTAPFVSDAASQYPLWVKTTGADSLAVSMEVTHPVNKSHLVYDIREFNDELSTASKLDGIQATAREIDGVVISSFNQFGRSLYDTASRREFLDIAGWGPQSNGTGTPIFDNTSTFKKFSTKPFRFGNTTAGDSTVTGKKISLTSPIDLSQVDTISFWVYVDGDHIIGNVPSSSYGSVLFVAGDLNFVNAKATNIFGAGGGSWHRGWNNITVCKTDFVTSIAGTINWGKIQSFQIRVDTGSANSGALFHLDSVFFGGSLNKIPVCITLDDSNKDSITIAEIMNAHGVPVSLFVIPDFIDNHSSYPDYMTLEECNYLYTRGNHIGFHHEAVNAFAKTPDFIKDGKDWVYSKGFTRDNGHLYGSYPNGTYNQPSIDYAKSIGIKGIRSLVGVSQNTTVPNEASTGIAIYESVLNGGIADPYRVNSDKPATASSFQTNLDIAISKKAAYLTYHHLISEVGTVAEWEAIAKYLKTKIDDGTIECLTFPQFCRKYESI